MQVLRGGQNYSPFFGGNVISSQQKNTAFCESVTKKRQVIL